MKSILFRLLSMIMLSTPIMASAQSGPVVVELFTSQGCSSCPPADDFLADMISRDDVLPLALHVDYWDRLGWKDTFATKAYTERQYAYGRNFNNRSVWTPQFVVQGQSYSRGEFRNAMAGFLKKARASQSQVALQTRVEGGALSISATPQAGNLPEMVIIVAGYTPKTTVSIKRGENAGRRISYHNTVHSWNVVGKWNGRGAANLNVPLPTKPPFAVIVQGKDVGQIFAAANIK